jgi:probable HAF family extracellular repeat protein
MGKAILAGRLLTALAGAATLSSVAFGQTAMFSVKALAKPPGETQAGAIGINDAGDVVGTVSGSSQCPNFCAVIWVNGVPTLLGAVAGATKSSAISINNSGEIAGIAAGDTFGIQAVIWNNGTPTPLPGAYSSASNAAFLNDAGQVVGTEEVSAVEWNGLTETVLGLMPGDTEAGAAGVNNNNLVVGFTCCANGSGRATVWHGTVPSLLPSIIKTGGSDNAYAVNNSGVVVGAASTGAGRHAAAWANGVVTDLGALNTISSALAVNNRGIIVGEADSVGAGDVHAVLWSRIGAPIQDLNNLISATAASEILLTGATAINDNCTIVVEGYTRKTKLYEALLLTLNDPSKCVNGL